MTRNFTNCGWIFSRISLRNVHKRASKNFRGRLQVHSPAVMCGLAHLKEIANCKISCFSRIISTFATSYFSEPHVSTGSYKLRMDIFKVVFWKVRVRPVGYQSPYRTYKT
ncbi:unnamed protein product, partial [Sphacelaria rigidula]